MTIWFHDRIDLEALNRAGQAVLPGHLGIRFVEVGDDFLRATMPVDARTHQPFGRLHGGASVALAETVASVGSTLTLDPAAQASVGMEINANHVRPVRDGHVTATGRPEAIGRTSQVWSVRIEDAAGRLVCISRVTMAVIASERA